MAVATVDSAPSTAPAGRLLLVDDQPANLDLLRRRLERAGYHVVCRSDALNIEGDIARERVDLVLLDWMMPHRSGHEALSSLRALFDAEHMPVIVATAAIEVSVIAAAFEAGANAYVPVPINVRELLVSIKVQLERRRAVLAQDADREGLDTRARMHRRELIRTNTAL